jgi:glutamine amidotransferase
MNKVTIIDYGMGNIYGLSCAIKKIGFEPTISSDINYIKNSHIIILPGVGSFGAAMRNIKSKKIDEAISHVNKNNGSIFGICLGMQLFFEKSEESPGVNGLAFINGNVLKLKNNQKLNVGWSKNISQKDDYLSNLLDNGETYFIHSYKAEPQDKDLIWAVSSFEKDYFCSAVKKKNIIGFQFHPEKSGEFGLKILKIFLERKN